MLYDRIRIILHDSEIASRDTVSCKKKYDNIFEPMGGRYSGFVIHNCVSTHFYIIDEPTDIILSELFLIQNSLKLDLYFVREYKGLETEEFSLPVLIQRLNAILGKGFFTENNIKSSELAKCWESVKVLENIISRKMPSAASKL